MDTEHLEEVEAYRDLMARQAADAPPQQNAPEDAAPPTHEQRIARIAKLWSNYAKMDFSAAQICDMLLIALASDVVAGVPYAQRYISTSATIEITKLSP